MRSHNMVLAGCFVIAAFCGCATKEPSSPRLDESPDFLKKEGAFTQSIPPTITVNPKLSTKKVNKDADDCAIWIHPTNPSQSIVIGTDKGSSNGGLFVWNLSGIKQQYVKLNHPNNVDVRYGMLVGGQLVDIAVVNVRSSKTLKVYKIDPATSTLIDITTSGGIKTPELKDPYGLALYRRPTDGAMFVFESTDGGDTRNVHQYRLQDDGAGKVKGTHIRAFGSSVVKSLMEGMVADDQLGYFYVSEEKCCVHKFYADPDLANNNRITVFANADGIQGDREGLAIYGCADGTGYILLSSQGNQRVKIYLREGDGGNPLSHTLLTTIITTGSSGTDGLEVTNRPAAPNFLKGFLAKHNSSGKNFALYAWEDIAQTSLTICTGNQ